MRSASGWTWVVLAWLAVPVESQPASIKAYGGPGTVTVPLAEYDRLVERASRPLETPDVPPVDAVVSDAELRLRVEKDTVLTTLHLRGEVYRRGAAKVRLLSGAAVTEARIGDRAVPMIAEDGGASALLSAAGPFSIEVGLALEARVQDGVASLTLPALPAGSTRARMDIPGSGIDVKLDHGIIVRKTSAAGRCTIEATLEPDRETRVSWPSREAAPIAAPREARWLSEVKTLVTLDDASVRLAVLLDVSVLEGQPARFEIALPEEYGVVDVSGPTLASSQVEAGRLDLMITAPAPHHQFLVLLDRATVETSLQPPILSVVGSQRETGELAVEGVGTMELVAKESGTLRRLDVREISEALRALAHYEILAGFRFHRQPQDPPALGLELSRFPDAPVLNAIAEQATVTTLATSQGRTLTEVALVVRNQAQPFLKVALPPDARLLSAEVAGETVKPVEGTDGTRVPLLRSGFRPNGPYAVSFVYVSSGAPFVKRGDAQLVLPRIDMPIEVVRWEVFLPDRYQVERRGGNMLPETEMSVRTGYDDVDALGVAGGAASALLSSAQIQQPANDGRDVAQLPISGSGQIRGRVVDSTNQVLPGARVTATVNGVVRHAVTDAQGAYVLNGLGAGSLRLTAELTGFATREVRNAQFHGSGRYDLRLDLGALTETVTVESGGSKLDVAGTRHEREEQLTAPSANVANLQRRVAGVLPIDVEVPREGTSHRFVRALVLDEETTLAFRYRQR
jgi:hypothetical protein